jgi:alpha-amylase/alpha-mannosidase (GH57 family)
MKRSFLVTLFVLGAIVSGGTGFAQKAPLELALVWHQHQPVYRDALSGVYALPWVRVHGVQEYIDSPRILAETPGIHVTFNLEPCLLEQILDYVEITPQERAKGGLYEVIGAIDDHLQWIQTLFQAPQTLSPEARGAMQEQFFWINGAVFDDDANDPCFDPRYAALNDARAKRDLTDAELRDAAGLNLLWEISPELHASLGLTDLRGRAGFTWDDILRLLRAQHTVLSQVVDAYLHVQDLGSELITSPFYHPILPLLCDHGWEGDAQAQLDAAEAQHERLFGRPAAGVWPPEQAVSQAAIALLARSGFSWTVTDEGLLAQSLGHTPSLEETTALWEDTGIEIFFRDTDLSDRIGLSYGNKPTQIAVDDFMTGLRRAWDALPDPAGHLLVVALDGENWMFMAGYPDNGRAFLRALYQRLEATDWVRTVTPSEFLGEAAVVPRTLPAIVTGSWAGGLGTWIGESDEDAAWAQLSAARDAVASASDPAGALQPLYTAEGSDWFWWYGSDQDSGTDEVYDALFKANLIAAYEAAGTPRDQVPPVLFVRLVPPTPVSLGEVSGDFDGRIASEDDWSGAVALAGTGPLRTVSVGYREGTLCVRVEADAAARTWIGSPWTLSVYVSGGPGDRANAGSETGAPLGFAPAFAARVNFAKVGDNGRGTATVYRADGAGGWSASSPLRSISSRRVYMEDVTEFTVPLAELHMEPGQAATLTVTLEDSTALLGELAGPPVLASIPTLVRGTLVFEASDPTGDDDGPGTTTYPTDAVFGGQGLFDLTAYRIYDAQDAWQFAFDFTSLPNPWNGPQGFSHPIIFLYLDVSQGGSTASHEDGKAARVAFSPAHPWDVFLKIAGWPAYGRHLWTASGQGPFLVEVASDPRRGRVIVTVPKTLLPSVAGWHYVLVASQDGYGENDVRAIGTAAGQWIGGGNRDPVWAPQVYDVLLPAGVDQHVVLGGFSPGAYAVLQPIEVNP